MEPWNGSFVTEFILFGFTDNPQMKILIFVAFLFIYMVTLFSNSVLIFICVLEPHLHTPMYFFLVILSIVDILYISSIVPNLLVHVLLKTWTISFLGCATQMFTYLVIAGTEHFLLTGMAFDRYVAICHPLQYTKIMRQSVCIKIAAGSFLCCIVPTIIVTYFTVHSSLCGHNIINNFFCEATTLLAMSCADTSIAECLIFTCGFLEIVIPTSVILFSYVRIIFAVVSIKSSKGRSTAFSTCSSHLVVVTIIYGSAIYNYMTPMKNHNSNLQKAVSLIYTVGAPFWNPIIYSLRNKDIKLAARNLMKKYVYP